MFTSEEGRFTKCFKSYDEQIDIQFKRWKRNFDKAIYACFRKIRVKEKVKMSLIDNLMQEKTWILKKKNISEENERRVEDIEQLITNEIAEKEFGK